MSDFGKRLAGFAAVFVAALLILLPLRLAIGTTGLAARAAEGSIWSGRLLDAQWRGAGLGDLQVGVAPLALLGGQLRIGVEGAGLEGAILKGGRSGLAAMTGSVGLAGETPLPLTRLEMTGVDIGFAGSECVAAAGTMRITASLPGAGDGIFTGAPRCDGGKLLLPLESGAARMAIKLGGDGAYTAMVTLDNVDEAARAGLLATGFQPTPTGLVLNLEGRL